MTTPYIPFQMVHESEHLSIFTEYGVPVGEVRTGRYTLDEINRAASLYGLALKDHQARGNGLTALWFCNADEINEGVRAGH
jgi:hypothetical protein